MLGGRVLLMLVYWFFFFQAEDGIRDHCVTGVQTCALPICPCYLFEISQWRVTESTWHGATHLCLQAHNQSVDTYQHLSWNRLNLSRLEVTLETSNENLSKVSKKIIAIHSRDESLKLSSHIREGENPQIIQLYFILS